MARNFFRTETRGKIMTEYFSPLRYPGGKGKLVPFFERLIIDNGLSDGVYIEP